MSWGASVRATHFCIQARLQAYVFDVVLPAGLPGGETVDRLRRACDGEATAVAHSIGAACTDNRPHVHRHTTHVGAACRTTTPYLSRSWSQFPIQCVHPLRRGVDAHLLQTGL